MGVLSTENRKTWSSLRSSLSNDKNNASCLHIVDNALFIVCLDDATPSNLADMCSTFLCGTYVMDNGVQVGTCTNRWYDKVRVIAFHIWNPQAFIYSRPASNHCLRGWIRWHQF